MVWMRLRDVDIDFSIYAGLKSRRGAGEMRANVGGAIGSDHRDRTSIHALRDITLDLREGDRLGLVGGNGAGKTTLLRVMAGVYEPTSGSVVTRGRVVALFSGSLGMDMELPGYENIMLRGQVLGLTRKQVLAKMDDIVAFTELEDYLHLPMRTYSAGMRMRLAFGVTTAVDADILLLDEGVGAGDDAFRAKAQARLNQFIERAGILVLATHSTSLMEQLCDRAIWLDHGEMRADGPTNEVIAAYRTTQPAPPVHPRIARRTRWRRRRAREAAAAIAATEAGARPDQKDAAKPDIVFDF